MTPSGPPDDRSHAPESDAAARSRASDAIWTVMDGTAFATGAEFFPALVQQLAQALDVTESLTGGSFSRRTNSSTRSFVLTWRFFAP